MSTTRRTAAKAGTRSGGMTTYAMRMAGKRILVNVPM